jgi:hypothetical protein
MLGLMLEQNGDTDTNACIAGGLIGARVGYSKIPHDIKFALINYGKGMFPSRPAWLIPGRYIETLIIDIVKSAPSSFQIDPDSIKK